MVMIKRFFARHFPAPWWMYPRSNYRLYDASTYHHKLDPVDRLVRGVRMAAGMFWWSFLWGTVWTCAAAMLWQYFQLPFWPVFGIYVFGEFSGRCDKDRQRALLEVRGRESDLAMAKEGIPE